MLHLRQRFLTKLILKRLKISPVVAIQGARQTGKSLLARELITKQVKNHNYVTLDQKGQREFASRNPDSFLQQFSPNELVIIDEVQKSPELFDAIKAKVDLNRRPGQFLILGSTEFSTLSKIRESLTGRMSRVKLHPLTVQESLKINSFQDKNFTILKNKNVHQQGMEFNRHQLLNYLERGGMPGHLAIRDQEVRIQLQKDWMDLVIYRDLQQFSKRFLSSDLAFDIIEKLATLSYPTAQQVGASLKVDTRKIMTHLKMLESLFFVRALRPHVLSTGQDQWFLIDPALVGYFNGPWQRKLQTWILNELLVANTMRLKPRKINFYRNSKGSLIDFIAADDQQQVAISIFDSESVNLRDLSLTSAFIKKASLGFDTIGLILAGTVQDHAEKGIYVRPWEWFI